MNRLPVVALVVLFFCTGMGAAIANCSDYGAKAMVQHNENVALGCGFSGLRWHGDMVSHTAFCSLAGEGTAAGETALREAQLDQCRSAVAEAPVDAPDAADEANTPARHCQKSEIAEGSGASTSLARGAAQSQLGRQQAEMLNGGLTQCLFHDLGCAGSNPERTCWMSVECCAK